MSELQFILVQVLPDGSWDLGELFTPDRAPVVLKDIIYLLPQIQDGGSLVIRRATAEEIDDKDPQWSGQHYGPFADEFADNH